METATLSPTCDSRTSVSSKPGEVLPATPGNTPTTPQGDSCALPARYSSGSYYGYTSETFSLKYQSGDGDTLELTSHRETFEMSQWQGEKPSFLDDSREAKAKDAEDGKAIDGKQDLWGNLHELMQQVKKEMQTQQLNVLKALLGKGENQDESLQGLWEKLVAARKASSQDSQGLDSQGETEELGGQGFSLKVTMEESHLRVEVQQGEEAGDYWNAENTSNRIVNFAMQFAGAHGDDPDGFAAQIREAIERGFGEAAKITGPLQGESAKLNQDTHRLTFEKLESQLADRQATPYNELAFENSFAGSAKPVASAHINLAA